MATVVGCSDGLATRSRNANRIRRIRGEPGFARAPSAGIEGPSSGPGLSGFGDVTGAPR